MAAERKGSRSLKPDMARQNTFSGAPGVFLPLIILESDANRRGDLFGRLMGDLFAALGYESFRFNIHKSGREIDLEGEHRQEARRVIAECKATESPIGGDDLNKFYGVLDIEKRKVASSKQISGYFVSLSGFTETAIEQEREAKEPRFVCLNGAEAIAELVKGRIIVSEARALEIAGPCVSEQHLELSSEASAQLLAHRLGWIWAIYFGLHMERTHLVLVHADGIALSNNLAQIVVHADQSVGGILHSLKYIAPIAGAQQVSRKLELTQRKYFEYIAKECGEVQLEGLPADQDLGSRRLRLENIFVPLHLVAPSDEAAKPKEVEQPGAARVKRKKAALQGSKKRESIGKVLTQVQRLAVLGLPGGGKSTLLKRLAIAYASPTGGT